jgi:hypothetical protein
MKKQKYNGATKFALRKGSLLAGEEEVAMDSMR